MTTTFTILRGDTDVVVSIEWIYHRACRGARDSIGGVRGAGPPLEPDEPAELEFVRATGPDKKMEWELTEDEIERAREAAWEEMNDAPEPDIPFYGEDY